jgi:flavin reductase (DIM6/NTAB) family NADH-FMN oxidoreductase RutF
MSVTQEEFRAALGRFASGVTVVTTCDASSRPHGLTVSAFCSLSLQPPLVLICIDRSTPSHNAFNESKAFVVNILGSEQETLSRHFALHSEDKFAGVAYRKDFDGIPVLENAIANLRCRLVQSFEGGDHTIFIGEVEAVTLKDDAPLVYYRGGYARLAL